MGMVDHFPKMFELRQHYPVSPSLEFSSLLREQFIAAEVIAKIQPGMKVAVGVGSRGITNLPEIVKTTLGILIEFGAEPFIIPAMGSHGGATPEGQEKVLAGYGITRQSMAVPIDSSMDVQQIGTTSDGSNVVLSTAALQADAIIVIGRIKPHTDFKGDLGSGIQKMLTVGLGKKTGAANAHRAFSRHGYIPTIRKFSELILAKAPVLCGVGIIEDQHHQTADLRVIKATDILSQESSLLLKARSLMASIPFDEIDLLIVDQIGKEISGCGMDTNVIGRNVLGYSASLEPDDTIKPHILRIFVRDLSPATKGNGIGIGLADFTTSRVVRTLDLQSTYVNAISALDILLAKIPMYFDTDREALEVALDSLVPSSVEKLRVVRIADTLNLDRMLISEALISKVRVCPELALDEDFRQIEFDASGNLKPF